MTLSRGIVVGAVFVSGVVALGQAQDVFEVFPLEPQSAPAVAADETPQAWFVELASPPAAEGTSANVLAAERAAFRSNALAAGITFIERFAYGNLFNGLSIQVAPGRLSALARLPGVVNLHPVQRMSLDPITQDPAPELATALAMTGADVVQNVHGFTGQGVRVAVMDSGIDYDHPDLGGCFGPGCRVEVGYDFVGDEFDNDEVTTTKPDPDPDDCDGHGTHVAGIVGANGGIKGVAPGVTFGAYRVFGCEGTTTSDILLAAMERILADGADVLNISIGAALDWPQSPMAVAASRMVNQGIVVVASQGNEGALGLYAGSAPALGDKVIAVASFENTHVVLPYFTITPDARKIGYQPAAGAPAPPTTGSAAMARTGTPTSAADACAPLPAGSLAGRVALIRRGTCSFNQKAFNAQSAGAAGVVIYNNVPGRISVTVVGPSAITIPVVSVSDAEGVLIDSRLATGAVTMTWTDQEATFPNVSGNLISNYSSYGLSPDLSLKPDIGAPGGLIRSTLPLQLGGYGTISGTSMSSPHVAGAAALLLHARPNTSSQAVGAILQNSAGPRVWWGNPALGFLDNVHRQGAGMLQIDDAILATTHVSPARLPLGESESGPAVRQVTIFNTGTNDRTYLLSHQPALSTGPNTFVPSFTTGFASVSFTVPSVTIPAGASAAVGVTVTANAQLANRSLYGGYIVVTPQGGGQPVRVPYAGFKGDYQSIQVLTPTPAGFPWLGKLTPQGIFNQPNGASYTMTNGDVPFIIVHLDHQVRRLRMEVFDAVTNKAWHRALDLQYLPRNASSGGAFLLDWDGRTVAGLRLYTVPDGQYVIELSVLKALGDHENPAHWENWTSPVITIDRP